uniref:NADH dehydrogenase subunit 6 n=1 Tax=Mosgovoyia sp. SQ20 TaxID=2854040 RepID=UPI001F148E1E|nr:NADH dehydrogenase subunit 6 [Mosgovoyia sp. SQ20]UKS08008.1 NADH dehydrogenase subunit 6 [Mosgovoyia sp. SQ20]
MVLVSILFFVYFLTLFLFSLINHPVYYCGLLVINSLTCSGICYLLFGFSWYSLLFCLVYVGGVYILFVFVSIYSPNSSYVTYFDFGLSSFIILIFGVFVVGSLLVYGVLCAEFSSFLCTPSEGVFYVLICLTLLFSFVVLSSIMSVKMNYYR